MVRRKRLQIALVSALAAALGACGSTSTPPKATTAQPGRTPASPKNLPVISVTTFPTSPYLSVWVAEQQHFDTKHGIHIKEVQTAGGNTLYTPLVGGQADASEILPSITMVYAGKGIVHSGNGRLVVLPAITDKATPEHPATAIFVGAGIHAAKDLIGKTIATHNLVSGFYLLAKTTLAGQGVPVNNNAPSASAAHVVVLPMAQMPKALLDHRIDAGIADYYTAEEAVALGAGHILEPVMGAGEWTDYPYISWVFNGPFYRGHSTEVTNFLLALLDANRWILNHKVAAKELLAKRMGTPPSVAAKLLPKYPMDGYTTDLRVNLSSTPIQKLYDALLKAGAVPKKLPLSDIYEPSSRVDAIQRVWESHH